jgi:ankyrin repeat protein
LTPYQVALRHGDAAVVALLESKGERYEATPMERFLAACGRADRAAAAALVAAHPSLPRSLSPADLRLMTELAQRDQVEALGTLLDCGVDIEAKGDWGGTAIHHAAWHGAVAAVELLLARGAAVESVNAYGGTVLGAALYGSTACRNAVGDHTQVVERLLEAGAKVLPHMYGMGSEAADEVLRTFGE